MPTPLETLEQIIARLKRDGSPSARDMARELEGGSIRERALAEIAADPQWAEDLLSIPEVQVEQ